MSHRTIIMVKRTYLHVSVITMITALVWLAMTLYRSVATPADVAVDESIRAPITPSFDEEVFKNIISRENLRDLSFEPPKPSANPNEINIVTTPSEPLQDSSLENEVVLPEVTTP